MTALTILLLAALGVWIAACIIDLLIQGVREIRWERRVRHQQYLNRIYRDDLPY